MASKPKCKYGTKCYRKNPQHQKDFDHSREEAGTSSKDDGEQSEVGDDEAGNQVRQPVKRKNTGDNPTTLKRANTRGAQKNTLDAFFNPKKPKLAPDNVKEISDNNSDDAKCKSSELCDESQSTIIDDLSDVDEKDLIAVTKVAEKAVQAVYREKSLDCESAKEVIDEYYSVKMPEDFYQFWEFCSAQNKENPAQALRAVGLKLVGPYDLFTKKITTSEAATVHLHYRYYYDPPEFMTVLAGDNKQFHIGYFRDDPSELPVFAASNSASDNCVITPHGENLFSAVKWFLEREKDKPSAAKLLTGLCEFSEKRKICLDSYTPKMKQRQKKVVCKTFHGAGLVVPVDQNDVGYRPVPETPANLKKMLKKIVDSKSEDERNTYLEPIEEIITYIQFANDECDYGEGVELGLDLLSFGGEVLHPLISSLLCVGYRLLKRDLYSDIVKAFLPLRRKDRPICMISNISR